MDKLRSVTSHVARKRTYQVTQLISGRPPNGNRTDSAYVVTANNRTQTDGRFSYEYDDEGNRTPRTKISDGSVIEYRLDQRDPQIKIRSISSSVSSSDRRS